MSSASTQAVISIGSGVVTLDFATAPLAGDWSTNAAGLASSATGEATYANAAQLDAGVNTIAQSAAATALAASATNPPSVNASGRYNSTLFALQTRPLTVNTAATSAAAFMIGRLQNTNAVAITDLSVSFLGAVFNNGGTEQIAGQRVYFSLTGLANSWTNIAGLNWSTAGTIASSFSTAGWLPGANAYILFADDNNTAGAADNGYTIDNLTFTPTLGPVIPNIKWNVTHTVGGAPSGTFEVSANQYWLNGPTPTGFSTNDAVFFSDSPASTAVIDVPANITATSLTVDHSSGTYQIGGAGSISSTLIKNGAGNLKLTSANAFGNASLSGGTVVTENAQALGFGGLAATGAVTLQTDSDLVVSGAYDGLGLLTKTGAGVLTLNGTSTASGGMLVNAGALSTNNGASIGAASNTVTLNGTALQFTNVGAATTVVPIVAIGTGGGTISIADTSSATASGATFAAGRLTGSEPITKAGPGVLRISGAQAGLSSNWIVDAGVVEVSNATGLGTGPVTLNSGVLVLNGVTATNNVTLAGGALGTRTNSNGNFGGAVNVTANSFLNVKSSSSPAGYQGFTVSGLVSGTSDLTLTGPIPLIANGTVAAGTAAVFANTANTYSGNFNVTSQQILASNPTVGAGSALGTATLRLKGGGVRILDNGAASGSILTYNNPVFVETQTEIGALAGTAGIYVDRTATGTFTGNTVQFPSLSIGGGLSLAVTGANGYKASVSGTTTLSGTGVATFDTSTAALTLAGGVTGTGGLSKTGASTLTVQGTVNYAGNTAVDGGVLDVTGVTGGLTVGAGQTLSGGGGTVTGASAGITVGSGAIIAPGNTTGVGVLTLSSLSLGTGSINYAWNTGTLGSLTVLGSDALALTGGTGSVTLNFANQSPNLGLHTLIDYAGTPLADLTKFTIGSMFSRIAYGLVNNTVDTRVELNVTGLNYPIWSGATSSEWSINVLGAPKNWKLNSDSSNTDFIAGDRVVFNDAAVSVAPTVDVSVADVSPVSVEVDGTKDYTFTGTAAIAGTGSLTKAGTGKLTISSTNSFTGAVNLNGGVTSVVVVADSAVNSPLGAGNLVNFGGGTLEFTGVNGSTNRGVAVAAGGGTVSTPTGTTLTLGGVLSGVGTLAKTGDGTIVLTGGTNTVGSVTVSQGTLQVGDGTASGSVGTGIITNNAALVFNTPVANLAIANEIVGTGTLTKTGPGNLSLGGLTANTYTGVTTVSAGILTANKPTGVDAIAGDLSIDGGAFVYQGNNVSNQIADTATITLNGGTFGNVTASGTNPVNPGASETVANVIINGGTFSSSRAIFTATGNIAVNGGVLQGHRGALIVANGLTLGGAAVIDLDGGSGTAGNEPRLRIGAGGLTLASGTINFNQIVGAAPAAGAVGSRLELEGNVASTGTSSLVRLVSGVDPKAEVDLRGGSRTFDVTGTLNVGATGAVVSVINSNTTTPGGIIKQGLGNLVLSGANTYNGDTDILAGTLTLSGTLSGSATINVATGAIFNVTGATGYAVGATQTLKGNGNVVGSATIDGTLAPGSSIGTLNFANDVVLSATGIGSFEINKSGVVRTADLANVTGTLTLAGTLNVTATGDTLVEGDKFNLFDAAAFSGTMAMGTMPTLDPGLFWSLADLGVDGTISVIPEPGSAALLALGSALLFRRRRKA